MLREGNAGLTRYQVFMAEAGARPGRMHDPVSSATGSAAGARKAAGTAAKNKLACAP